VAVELRNSSTPLLAFVSTLVLTVAPLPVGDILSASRVMVWADAIVGVNIATKAEQANKEAQPMRRQSGFNGVFIAGEMDGLTS